MGIRRKGSARRKGWTLEAAERQKRLPGTGGWGGGDVELRKLLGTAQTGKVCLSVGGALRWESGHLDFMIGAL